STYGHGLESEGEAKPVVKGRNGVQQVQRKDISQLTDMERLRYKACYTERIEGIPARWNHLSMDVLENELRAEARKVIPIERRITDSDHDTDEEINRTSRRRRRSDSGGAGSVWRFPGGEQVLGISDDE